MITEERTKYLIAKAIDQHNKNATLISMGLGFGLMFFYADGLIRIVEGIKGAWLSMCSM